MNLHQAYLLIGPEEASKKWAISFMQQYLCSQGGCTRCVDCTTLIERRHYALTWLQPEGTYTIKQFESVSRTVSYALDAGKHYFIVIERADLCNATCANGLLKSLEEPLPGYHYILLSPRKEGILPTISSRCIVEHLDAEEPVAHRLVPFFTDYQFAKATDLVKELEKLRVAEHEIGYLLDACLHYWHEQRLRAINEGNRGDSQKARLVEEIIEKASEKPPMPGSSNLFLKNLFLQLSQVM